MASKALFTALEQDLFTELADGLTGLGLTVLDRGHHRNAPAAQRWLVRGSPDAYGDYLRLQASRQIYPALVDLDAGMAGTGGAFDTLAGLLADSGEARTFLDAQHAASLRPARALARRLPIRDARSLFAVGGGSGAFTIALLERNPMLRATLAALPAGVDVARDYLAEAGVADRVDLVAGDALGCAWPGDQDVVLMSYLISAPGDADVDTVLERAHAGLRPDGLLVLHDFMPEPTFAAPWFLHSVAYQPGSFSVADLRDRLRDHGFVPTISEVLIPGTTTVVLARKEAVR
jgi:predicted O-methyltransferase YrrM